MKKINYKNLVKLIIMIGAFILPVSDLIGLCINVGASLTWFAIFTDLIALAISSMLYEDLFY